MLKLIGLGLWRKQVTLEALEELRSSDKIYYDYYTNISQDLTLEELSRLTGKPIVKADRGILEYPGLKNLVREASKIDVSIAVVGDPLAATTHVIILEEARKQGVPYKVVHGVSGLYVSQLESFLQPYRFGRTATVTFPYGGSYPVTTVRVVYENLCLGLHSLLLMDLKLDEPRLMTIGEALSIMNKIEQDNWGHPILGGLLGISLEAAGTPYARVKTGCLDDLRNEAFDRMPQSLVIPGRLHFAEEENLTSLLDTSSLCLDKHKETLESGHELICKRAGLMLDTGGYDG